MLLWLYAELACFQMLCYALLCCLECGFFWVLHKKGGEKSEGERDETPNK